MLVFGVGVFEFVDGVSQRFRHKTAAVDAEMTFGIGLLVVKHSDIFLKILQRFLIKLRICSAYGLDELMDFVGIFDAFEGVSLRVGCFDA